MDNRHFSNSFRTMMYPGLDRNHLPAEQSYIHMGRAAAPENGSLVYPTDPMFRGGVHFTSQQNVESRANPYSSFSMEAPNFQPAFSGPSSGPLPHTSFAGNLYLAPENSARHPHSNHYERCTVKENEHGVLDSVTSSGLGPFKRKRSDVSVACERSSTSRFYGAGSSSSSSGLWQVKPTSHSQDIPSVQSGLPHYMSNLSIAGEYSLRNVRRRTRFDLEPNPVCTPLPTYSSHHYLSTTHPSNYHEARNLNNMNADRTTPQWNFNTPPPAAHGRIQTSGTNGLTHESNWLPVRGSGTRIGGCHSDFVPSRNLVSSSQYLHTSHIPCAREGHHSHPHRATPTYRAGRDYSQLGHVATSTEICLQALPETYSSYPTPSAREWGSSQCNGRLREAVGRFQFISSMVDNRIGYEDIMMMDQYGDTRLDIDQYGDMRLDIDNMGYEELLALGERIGNVSTGMSEDMILKCLTKTMYSADQKPEEGTCAICLEDYAEEEVGTIKNCGHEYHATCIRKWLLTKNACPICKAPAL